MDALILALLLVGLAAYVAAPLYGAARPAVPGRRGELEARHEALIRALRELELDHATGLVGPQEHARQREQMEAEAAELLRQLETTD